MVFCYPGNILHCVCCCAQLWCTGRLQVPGWRRRKLCNQCCGWCLRRCLSRSKVPGKGCGGVYGESLRFELYVLHPNHAAKVATTLGPIMGPPVAGFISVVSWSWAFWVGAIFAGATWPLFYFLEETYGPVILKRRAERLRKETGDDSIVAPIELEKRDLNHVLTVVLTRPLRMIIFEPLVLFTCLYLSYGCKSAMHVLDELTTNANVRCHILHVLAILPHNLRRDLWLQSWRNGPGLPIYWCRISNLRRHLPLLGLVPRTRATSWASLVPTRRDASSSTGMHCRPLFRHQCFLARLVGKKGHTLDSACACCGTFWHWISVHFHCSPQLSRRRLRYLCCFCHGGCVSVSVNIWCGTAVRSEANV